MRRRDCLKLAIASTPLLPLSGCLNLGGSDGENGDGDPTNGAMTSSTQSSGSPTPEVPTVTNPLDVSELKNNPCAALSTEQTQQFELKSGERGSSGKTPTCEYEYVNVVGNQVVIYVHTESDNGLATVYRKKDILSYFEPTQIGGYPAVYAGKYNDRDRGRCMLHIGPTDELRVTVFAQLNGGEDAHRPCEVAEVTAKAVIKHLKNGS